MAGRAVITGRGETGTSQECSEVSRARRHESGKAPGGQEEVGTEQGPEEPAVEEETCVLEMGAPGRLVGVLARPGLGLSQRGGERVRRSR